MSGTPRADNMLPNSQKPEGLWDREHIFLVCEGAGRRILYAMFVKPTVKILRSVTFTNTCQTTELYVLLVRHLSRQTLFIQTAYGGINTGRYSPCLRKYNANFLMITVRGLYSWDSRGKD